MKKLSAFQQKVIDFLEKKNRRINCHTHSVGKSTVKALDNLNLINVYNHENIYIELKKQGIRI